MEQCSVPFIFSESAKTKQESKKKKKTERENDIMIKIILKNNNKSSSLKLPVFSLSLFFEGTTETHQRISLSTFFSLFF